MPAESLLRQPVDYVILSNENPDFSQRFLDAGRVVLTVTTTPNRAGPPIRIVKLGSQK
jgi:hypothetical protein